MSIRDQMYAGEIRIIPRNVATRELTRLLEDVLVKELGERDLAEFFGAASPDTFADALDCGRSAIHSNHSVVERAWDVISFLGENPAEFRIDPPRLRVVRRSEDRDGLQKNDCHRDVWFAEPANQINLWVPFCNDAVKGLAIWPHYFSVPIQNTSECLDRPKWDAKAAAGGIIYPKALERPRGSYQAFDLAPGELVAFSANHLHCGLPTTTEYPRMSVDFRVVHVVDYRLGIGPSLPDNRSKGSTFARMLEYAGPIEHS